MHSAAIIGARLVVAVVGMELTVGTSSTINGVHRSPFNTKGSTPEFLVTWYDTSGDPTNTMTRVNYAVNTTFGIADNPFFTTAADGGMTPTIFPLSVTSPSPPGFPGQAIPWASNSVAWWDYQGIGVDPGSQSFFAAWGGDGRLVNSMANGPSGVWGVQLQ